MIIRKASRFASLPSTTTASLRPAILGRRPSKNCRALPDWKKFRPQFFPVEGALRGAFLIIFMFICLPFGFSNIAMAAQSFQETNALYQDGKYSEAAAAYEALLKSNPSPEIYYNLANAYFKDKKIGLAILNYERAKKLTPRDQDIRSNLLYMNRLLEYKVEDKRNWYLRKTSTALEYVTSEECWTAALAAYLIFIVGFLFAVLFRKKPLFGTGGALAFSLVLLCFVPLFLKYSVLGSRHKAVVTSPKADVHYGPSEADRLAFRLVEGLTVAIRDERENWYRIELTDGRSGWVPRAQVTSI